MTEIGRRSSTKSKNSPIGTHGRHDWMMVVCCIPMLIVAVVLVVSGVVGAGFIAYAVLCTAMMAAMMYAMNHGRMKM